MASARLLVPLVAIVLCAGAHRAAATVRAPGADGYFGARIARLEALIERRLADGTLPAGRATFMLQDLDRVSRDVGKLLAVQGELKPGEHTSYRLMLDRVERRLRQR